MKQKIVIITASVILFGYSLAYAWLPAAYAVVTALTYGGVTVLETAIVDSILVHATIGVAGCLVYGLTQNGNAKVSQTGNVTRDSKVTWVELGPNNTLPVKEAAITAKIPWDKLIAEFQRDKTAFKSKYPQLGAILEDGPDAYNYNMAMKVNVAPGSIVYCNGKFYRINSQTNSNVESSNNYPNGNVHVEVNNNVLWFRREVLPSGNAKADRYLVTQIAAPPSSPTTPEKFQYRATGNEGSPSNAKPEIKVDIDQLIQDAPNIVHFEDPVTGEEAKPSHATQAQINTALAQQKVNDKNQQAKESADTAAQNARAAADAAAARSAAAAAAAAANPGDAALAQAAAAAAAAAEAAERAADAAESAAKKLEAEHAKDEAERAKQDAEKEEENTVAMPGVPGAPSPPASLDFSGWANLKSQVQGKFPFNLMSQVVDIVGIFIAEPQPPVFDLPIYGGNTIHIDLSPFDVLAQICRWSVAALISIAGLQYAIGWWRGVT